MSATVISYILGAVIIGFYIFSRSLMKTVAAKNKEIARLQGRITELLEINASGDFSKCDN